MAMIGFVAARYWSPLAVGLVSFGTTVLAGVPLMRTPPPALAFGLESVAAIDVDCYCEETSIIDLAHSCACIGSWTPILSGGADCNDDTCELIPVFVCHLSGTFAWQCGVELESKPILLNAVCATKSMAAEFPCPGTWGSGDLGATLLCADCEEHEL